MTLRERIKKLQYFDNLIDVRNILLELIDEVIVNFIEDAPKDGNTYGRRNGEWTIVSGGGGGIQSVVGGTNVTIDNTDPNNPVINASANLQGLQEVLDIGDTWTNTDTSISVNGGGIVVQKDIVDNVSVPIGVIDEQGSSLAFIQIEKVNSEPIHATVQVVTPTGNSTLDSDIGLRLQNVLTSGSTTLSSETVPANENIKLLSPSKTTGDYTIATTEDITRRISMVAPENSATIQDNRLIGATELTMVVVNGTVIQNPPFDDTTGTITETVSTNDPITIFYTKP